MEAPDGYKLSGDLLTLPFDNGQALFPFSDVLQNLKLYYEKIDNPSNKMTATITHIDQNGKPLAKTKRLLASLVKQLISRKMLFPALN